MFEYDSVVDDAKIQIKKFVTGTFCDFLFLEC